MGKNKLLLMFVFIHMFALLCAQTRHYVKVLPMDGNPVVIYADSCKTKIIKVLQPEDFDSLSVSVSVRFVSSDMFGDKIWMYDKDYVPEFSGWVDKKQCFRHLEIDYGNCSYIYAKPDENSPKMEILSNRGLLVNVVDVESEWMKVKFLYNRIIEGWVRKERLKP